MGDPPTPPPARALVKDGIAGTALLPRPLHPALGAQPSRRSWGEGVEEEGSGSPGSPRVAPGGRCEAWTVSAASGLRPGGALGAPFRPARRAPRPSPWLTALHLAAFLGGRRVPHDWDDERKGSGRGRGAGAVPAAPQAEATPASAPVSAVSALGAGGRSAGGKTGPVLRPRLQQTPQPRRQQRYQRQQRWRRRRLWLADTPPYPAPPPLRAPRQQRAGAPTLSLFTSGRARRKWRVGRVQGRRAEGGRAGGSGLG